MIVKILLYLDPLDLCQVPLVCQSWYHLLSLNKNLEIKRNLYLKECKLNKERLTILLNCLLINTKIGIVYSSSHQKMALTIAEHLRFLGILTYPCALEYDNWFKSAKKITHLIIINTATMMHWPIHEQQYLENKKLSNVVVVQRMPIANVKLQDQGHCLERFLQLDYRESASWLAEAALVLFAGKIRFLVFLQPI